MTGTPHRAEAGSRTLQLLATVFIVGLLACGAEGDEACTANGDCPDGEWCTLVDRESGEGVCQGEVGFCSAQDECGVGNNCEEGQTCSRSCECEDIPIVVTWPFAAIVSLADEVTSEGSGLTSGADIDAIELISGGQSFFAVSVESFRQGNGAVVGLNDNVGAILGTNDAIPTGGGDCDLDGAEMPHWSIGDRSGFAVVSFRRDIEDADLVMVWELNDVICDNLEGGGGAAFDVFIASDSVDPTTVSDASEIGGSGWVGVGTSPRLPENVFVVEIPE